MLSSHATAGQGGSTPASRRLKIMPAVFRCCSRAQDFINFGLSALNRHLQTLAGVKPDSACRLLKGILQAAVQAWI